MVTRPDAPAGRGRTLVAVAGRAVRAEELGVAGAEARRAPRDPEFLDAAARARARLLPGRRLRRAGPAAPRSTSRAHGWVNLHFSLLPAWRGAAPVQHALMAGDEVTGATTFRLEEGLDTGPVVRRDDRDDPARRHRRRPARPAGRRPAPGCSSPRSTASRTARSRPVPQPAEGVSLAPKIDRRGRAGRLGPARARRRPAGPRLHPRARAPGRRSAASGSSSAR